MYGKSYFTPKVEPVKEHVKINGTGFIGFRGGLKVYIFYDTLSIV